MQVSAISSENIYSNNSAENLANNTDSVFTSSVKTDKTKEDIYKLINEWKAFCIQKESKCSFDVLA